MLRARAYLSRVAEPPAPALAAFVEAVGPVEAASRVRAGDVPDLVAGETAARRTVDRASADLTAADAAGGAAARARGRRLAARGVRGVRALRRRGARPAGGVVGARAALGR